MKIKAGNIWYDCSLLPIMVQLTDADKRNIANMPAEATRYAAFADDDGRSPVERLRWMDAGFEPEEPKA